MNLNVQTKPNGRKYLLIFKAYRDPVTKKPRNKLVESIGYLDELEKQYDDPIAHFRAVAKKMTEEEKVGRTLTMTVDVDEELPPDTDNRMNYGYAAIMKIYHELDLHEFFATKARYQKFSFNTNSIMLMLVISRALSPGSKKKAYEERGRYFERFNFELADVYRALSHFSKISSLTQKFMHEKICEKYGRDTSIVYFDATNFYFEIDEQDDLRKRGVSKERRPNPIVQMGLALDRDGVPINYKLFPGNKHDSETFRAVIGEICKNYGTGRVIVVGDMGVITADNIWYLIGDKPHKPMHGYIFSFSIRGGAKKFKEYVLEQDGYVNSEGKPAEEDDVFKKKTRLVGREIEVTKVVGGKMKKTVYEKQVIFWSKKYADKAKAEREVMLRKAMAFIKDPSKFKKHTGHGSAKYIMGIDKETGEVSPEQMLSLDFETIKEEEKYDGYYAIVTSEHNMPDEKIIENYRGLWEIEETFRVTKGELEARPVFVSREDRIEAHFLTCFIALTILRLLQKLTGKEFSSEKIIAALNRISGSLLQENLYVFDYRTEITNAISEATGVDFTKKYLLLGEIKKSLGIVKR
jgi:transposase